MESSNDRVQDPAPEVSPVVTGVSFPTLTFASLSIAVLCLAVFIVFSRKKSRSRGNVLLLVGPPDAGKTAILSTLVYKQTLPTHTSLQTNSSLISVPSSNKTLRIVDIPGHPRVRDQFREHLPDAKAVIFVVDSSTVSRNGAVVAEHLHHILHAFTSLPPSQTPPSLVILAHKTDLLKASSSSTASSTQAISRVKTILERELEKRRASQSGGVGVEGLGAEGEGSDIGGLECGTSGGGTFRFAEWAGGEVEFLGTYVKIGTEIDDEKSGLADGLEAFQEWMDTIS
jgi:signal recognition particle receptor subunit beta